VAVGLVAEGGYLHRPKPRILARFENQLFWYARRVPARHTTTTTTPHTAHRRSVSIVVGGEVPCAHGRLLT
jgi:hypothetical protein